MEKEQVRVLHVLNSAHGGSAISTFELIRELKRLNVESSLICFNNADGKKATEINALVEGRVLFMPLYWMNKRIRSATWKRPLIEVKSIIETWRGHRFQSLITEFIRKHKINIVHTSTILNPEGAIAAKKNKIPHVWHVRELIGPDSHYVFPKFKSWIKYVESHAACLVANSQSTAKTLGLFFSESKILCIPNGIDPDKYAVKNHTASDTFVVGMVGNVTSRWKNHEFFVKVAGHFRQNARVSFRIYGELPDDSDDYLQSLREIVRQNQLEKTVMFMGHHDNTQLMSQIDVLLHPTGLESFGRIFIEAMSSGIPIVAVDAGGAQEIVRNDVNGFRIPDGHSEAAAQMVRKLLDDVDLRARMGKAGREIVEEEYRLDTLAHRLFKLYRSLS